MVMKRIFAVILLSALFVALASQTKIIIDSCTSIETKKKCKEALKPFKYDASKLSRITFKTKPQIKELEIPLFFGEKYRFVFNTEGLPQDIDINIFDKRFEAKKRELLWTNKGAKAGQTQFVWEPKKAKKMYVTYDIPVTSDTIKRGCVVFVLGYKTK